MTKQVFIVHGGMCLYKYEEYLDFLKSYKIDSKKIEWQDWEKKLQKELGDEFSVILPVMPSRYNAKYTEWKIWFEKYFPIFEDEIILIGKSLGGIFLVKYLSENEFSKKIKAVILLAPPFEGTPSESIGDFSLPESLEKMGNQAKKIFLLQSKNDSVVPFEHMDKYSQKLLKAEKIIFKDKGHFKLEEFPEMIELIKSL